MADPTLGLTFDVLRVRVAEFLGIAYYGPNGDQTAQVPVDAHDLELVGRLVNDGYRRFLADHELGWNFLNVPLSITFGTGLTDPLDNSRYLLPDDYYGLLVHPFTYGTDGPRITIHATSEAHIRELKAGTGMTTGQPSLVAFRPINVDETADGQRWEAVFWPAPNIVKTVTAVYKRYPAALVNGTDRHVAGFQHDRAILAAALAEAELQRSDSAGPREQAYQAALLQSRKIDARTSDVRKKGYGDKSEDGPTLGSRPLNYYGVQTYNGVSLN